MHDGFWQARGGTTIGRTLEFNTVEFPQSPIEVISADKYYSELDICSVINTAGVTPSCQFSAKAFGGYAKNVLIPSSLALRLDGSGMFWDDAYDNSASTHDAMKRKRQLSSLGI
jgi:hypothetical protein